MTKQLELIQILYEISVAIGTSLDITENSKKSLSIFLRKLNCAAGEILIRKETPEGGYHLEPIISIPRSRGKRSIFAKELQGIPEAFTPDEWATLRAQLPMRIEEGYDSFLHILELPGFGLLLLKKREDDFEPFVIMSLDSILSKLAISFNNCLRNEKIEKMHRDEQRLTKELIEKTGALHESRLTLFHIMQEMKEVEGELRSSKETLEERVVERTRELEEMHAQMLIQEKMASVGQLAAGMAHELSNPVNFVRTNFSTLTDNFTDLLDILNEYRSIADRCDPECDSNPDLSALREKEESLAIDYILSDIPELFLESERGFERVVQIIQSIRDFSYPRNVENFVFFNINKGIEDTLIIARNIYKYHAEVRTELGEMPDVQCIPEQLNQVFLNLIVNSAHAIEETCGDSKGLIAIRTWYENDHAFCEVADTGPGIPVDIRSRIFEPFLTTKNPGKGTGLGLSISYDIIVNKHNGELTCECPEGGGSIFTIKIPKFHGEK